jgi:transcriptional regulator with XRE-family HTH domain
MKYCRILSETKLTLESISKETGLSVGYLSHLENESREPSKETMEKIAAALGKTVQEVFFTELTPEEALELVKSAVVRKAGKKRYEAGRKGLFRTAFILNR